MVKHGDNGGADGKDVMKFVKVALCYIFLWPLGIVVSLLLLILPTTPFSSFEDFLFVAGLVFVFAGGYILFLFSAQYTLSQC